MISGRNRKKHDSLSPTYHIKWKTFLPNRRAPHKAGDLPPFLTSVHKKTPPAHKMSPAKLSRVTRHRRVSKISRIRIRVLHSLQILLQSPYITALGNSQLAAVLCKLFNGARSEKGTRMTAVCKLFAASFNWEINQLLFGCFS